MNTETQQAQVITIDGPSGSGKGTISQLLAKELGWHFLDSGALYRLLALAADRHAIALDDEASLETLAEYLDVEFVDNGKGGAAIVLESEEVTDSIRTEEAGNAASKVAALPGVRRALLARQRAFREAPGLVADGRDMGTVVFPDATLKFYLTASAEERAQRRYKQLIEKGMDVNLASLVEEIAQRDARDASRTVAPLKPATDAVQIDTTGIGIEGVMEKVIRQVRHAAIIDDCA
jgi:cytidylate kinase